MEIIQTLAQQLNLTAEQVGKTVQLIDEGNTIPFIARRSRAVWTTASCARWTKS